jgi:hypothetical protein
MTSEEGTESRRLRLQKMKRQQAEKANLAGPPLPAVRGVAATFAAQDKDNCSHR